MGNERLAAFAVIPAKAGTQRLYFDCAGRKGVVEESHGVPAFAGMTGF
jgi:hypothetical protein